MPVQNQDVISIQQQGGLGEQRTAHQAYKKQALFCWFFAIIVLLEDSESYDRVFLSVGPWAQYNLPELLKEFHI